jgi:hypothetical protein
MNQPGKRRFGALEELVNQTKGEQTTGAATVVKDEPSVTEKKHPLSTAEPEKKAPRIPNKSELSEEQIINIARQAAEKATMDRLYGRRATYKGPRVTRSYRIDLTIDKWLDEMQQKTGIEKSTFVINAVRFKLEQEYPHLKPNEEDSGRGE